MSNPRRWRSEDILADQSEQINFRSVLRNKVEVKDKFKDKKIESEKPSWVNRRKSVNIDNLEKRNKNFAVNSNTPSWMNVLRKSTPDLSKIGMKSYENNFKQNSKVNTQSEFENISRKSLKPTPKMKNNSGKSDLNGNAPLIQRKVVDIDIDENNNYETKLISNKENKRSSREKNNNEKPTFNQEEIVKPIPKVPEKIESKSRISTTMESKSKTEAKMESKRKTDAKIENKPKTDTTMKSKPNTDTTMESKPNTDTKMEDDANIKKEVEDKTSTNKATNIQRRISQLDDIPKTFQKRASVEKITINKGKSLQERKVSLTGGSTPTLSNPPAKKKNSLTENNKITDLLRKKSVEIDINVDVKLKNFANNNKSRNSAPSRNNKVNDKIQEENTQSKENSDQTAAENEYEKSSEKLSSRKSSRTANETNPSFWLKKRNSITAVEKSNSSPFENKSKSKRENVDDVDKKSRFSKRESQDIEKHERKSKSDDQSSNSSDKIPEAQQLSEIMRKLSMKTANLEDDLDDITENEKEIATRQQRFKELKLHEEERKQRRHRESRRNKKNAENESSVATNLQSNPTAQITKEEAKPIDNDKKVDEQIDIALVNGHLETSEPAAPMAVEDETSFNKIEEEKSDYVENNIDHDKSDGNIEHLDQPKVQAIDREDNTISKINEKNRLENNSSVTVDKNDNEVEISKKPEVSKDDDSAEKSLPSMESLSQRIRRRQRRQSEEENTEIDFAARRRARRAKRLEEENAAF